MTEERASGFPAAPLDRKNPVDLRVCRYHQRRQGFGSQEGALSEQQLTFVERGVLPATVGGA